MASIGDLFFTFRGDGARLQADAKKEGTAAGSTMGQSFGASFKKSFSGKEFGKGITQGLGLAGALGAANIASSAISTLVDVVGDATEAAIAEEASISKLNTALRANVESYDGNTEAIERTLKARMELGFSDDEQRESLALLVAATKDATKALEIQRTAMDLARLKGISLQAASEALIRVEGGQFRMLKALGIQLPKNATAEQALAAVQKIAAGQAEAFASTAGGKLLVAQIKYGEALERLGGVLMPLVVEGAEAVADALESIMQEIDDADIATFGKEAGDAIRFLGDAFGFLRTTTEIATFPIRTLIGVWQELFEAISVVIELFTPWDEAANRAADSVTRSTEVLANTMDHRASEIAESSGGASRAIVKIGDSADGMAGEVEEATEDAAESVEEMRDRIVSAAEDIVNRAWEILDDRAALSAINIEKAELQKAIAAGTATAEMKARYRELTQEQTTLLLDLGKNGAVGTKIVQDAIVQLKADLKTATGFERQAILATLSALQSLIDKANVAKTVLNNLRTARINSVGGQGALIGAGIGGKASGGSVAPAQPYWVGEQGRELFVPDQAGTVVPHRASESMAAAASSRVINVEVQGLVQAKDPFEIADQIARVDAFYG
jgi:hypothetical protein